MARVKNAFLSANFASSVIAFPLFAALAMLADRLIPLVFGVRWIEVVGLVRPQSAWGIITWIGVLQALSSQPVATPNGDSSSSCFPRLRLLS